MRTRPALAGSLAVALLAGACRRAPELQPQSVVIGQITSAIGLDPHLHDEASTYSALSHFYEGWSPSTGSSTTPAESSILTRGSG